MRRPGLLLCLLLASSFPLGATTDHPNQPQGFSPERSYQMGLGGIDQVDLYSGRLSLTIPVGPFTLYYNNNVWRYEIVVENNQERVKAIPDRLTTAGLGWHLGWGELYHSNHWYNPSETQQWMYVGRDGKRHYFYDRMHYDDDPDGDTNVHYTRDNSYLRLVRVSTWIYDIEFPDGTTRRFENEGSLSSKPFRLVSSWSRFGSANDPDMEVTYNADDTLRTVTDRWDREHKVHLLKDSVDGLPIAWLTRVIDYIDVEGFGGARNVYDLEYRNVHVDVSCKDDSSSTPAQIRVPHLTEIQLPDGTAYTMLDGATPTYHDACEGGIDDLPGALKRIDLPTGGALSWTFQRFEFPPGDNWSVFNTAAGVATRRMLNADDSVAGLWTYKTRSFGTGEFGGGWGGRGEGTGGIKGAGTDPEMQLDVVAPEGDCTRHYFDAIYYVLPSQQRGWELGLPFTYDQESDGKYLSTEVYTSNDGNGLCAGTKLRSSYVRFRRDALPGCVYDPQNPNGCPRQSAFYDSNRTVEATRVVFHDDGDRWVDTERSDFDGLGNFREVETTGNLWTTANQERRHVRTGYDRVAGTYGQAGYAPPSTTTPWILSLLSSTQITENDAFGQAIQRHEYTVDPSTGALLCARQLKAGVGRSAQDLLTTYTYDGLGQLTDVMRYGSDLQSLPLSGEGCGDLPSANPLYWTTQTYQYGELETSRPRLPGGGFGGFYTHDVDLDPSTGLVTATRDTALYETTLDYDSTGRLTTITPQDGAYTTLSYVNAVGTSPAKVVTTIRGSQGFPVHGQSELISDPFGRPVKERVLRPGNVWSERETVLNARGWVKSVSKWGNLNLKTSYLEHDAFGRPHRIRPADGSAHDVTLAYLGNRKLTTTFKVQKSLTGGETASTKESEYDAYGRLRRVREGAGTGGAMVPTTYDYDVGNRMTRSIQGTSPQQVRRFDFDNRGFMTRERHPEQGANGNGWVNFYSFDPLGNPSRRTDGLHDLGYSYDAYGRLTQVYDRNESNRLVTTFAWDSGPGFGKGKVWKAARYNYIDLPWLPAAEESVKVEHIFNYQGISGAISQKDTVYTWPDGFDRFRQNYLYDDTGNLTSFLYPRCTTPACAGTSAATSQTVTYGYSLGQLRQVPGWVSNISYHSDGTWAQIDHSNGVSEIRDRHPQLLSKTYRLRTVGPTPGVTYYDSGFFAYDGAGNIKSLGTQKFAYDSASRLVAADFPDYAFSRGYEYDVFGNLLERSQTAHKITTAETFSVNPATNRLTSGATYDAAGNVTSYDAREYDYFFTYDTQNNLTTQAWMRYIYDASDERAGAVVNAPGRNMRFDLRDLGHRLVSEVAYYADTYQREEDTIYAGKRLLALTKPSGSNYRYHLDQVGSPRLLTGSNGDLYREVFLLPYGEEFPYEDSVDKRKTGGHERDFSTGTDYMHARHYYWEAGRFMSVDPMRGFLAQPQTLNRYAYVTGNPIRYSDPMGFFKGDEDDPFLDEITVCGNCDPSGGGPPSSIPGVGGFSPFPGTNGGGGGFGGGGGGGGGGGNGGSGGGSGGGAGNPGGGDGGGLSPGGEGGPDDPGEIEPEDVVQIGTGLLAILQYFHSANGVAAAERSFVASLRAFLAMIPTSARYGAYLKTQGWGAVRSFKHLERAAASMTTSSRTLTSARLSLSLAKLNLFAVTAQFAIDGEIQRSMERSAADLEWNLRNMRGPDDQSTLGNLLGRPMTNAEAADYWAAGRQAAAGGGGGGG